MKKYWLCAVLFVAVAACTRTTQQATNSSFTEATVASPSDPGFYLMLMWHQHQPRYPLLADGTVSRPWVRVHATKDYYDMASLIEEYPGVSVTFNLTPILLLQLEELANGTKDVYWTHTEIPADELTPDQREFVIGRFFDVNPRIVARFPRFSELADLRGSRDSNLDWQVEELRDLQVLFNLAWTDPDFLAVDPLAALVEQGRDFSEGDKQVVLGEHLRLVKEVISLHARLWDEGRIEVTTTPFAHPILPLIADTALASVGDPAAVLPENRLREVDDSNEHVVRGLDTAERLLGRRPVGMWPGEGSVAQLVMWLFSKNGVEWVASGEDVLAKSLDLGSFTRDGQDLVLEGADLYRPWAAQVANRDPVAMFFRDGLLSDLIGFEYSGMEAETATDNFMKRLRNIRDSLDIEAARAADRPYVVSVILDGENAWENYENDGKDFLNALYRRLSESDFVQTITPSQYLERFADPEPLGEVWPGAWFQPNFATWIGEDEESTAWDYLYRVRQDLKKAEGSPNYEAAFEKMLFAEGSDWFWWYGSDQSSGDDGYFDRAYRELLGQVYDALGQDRPSFVAVPIIPEQPEVADAAPESLLPVQIDGRYEDWKGAGRYDGVLEGLEYAFDRDSLYLRVKSGGLNGYLIYLGAPAGVKEATTANGTPLGFGATHVVGAGEDGCGVGPVLSEFSSTPCRFDPGDSEIAVPLSAFGPLEPGDQLLAKLVVMEGGGEVLLPGGPMAFQVPDISEISVVLNLTDPVGDDHGPGTYTYPTDSVFGRGSYDLETVEIGTEGEDLVVTFDVVAPIQNPWGSPRGFSVQTFDLYIDTDPGAGTGAQILIPGRNASLTAGNGWEFGVTVEGWEPAIYVAAADGSLEETKPSFDIITFADNGRVRVKLPLSLLGGGNPADWGYAAVVLSQEGFPSTGVRRVRDVNPTAQQWKIGGAPVDVNHTRILDVAWATEGEQEALLTDYAPTTGSLDDLAPDDFGRVPIALGADR